MNDHLGAQQARILFAILLSCIQVHVFKINSLFDVGARIIGFLDEVFLDSLL
jgi:hypothetical protein